MPTDAGDDPNQDPIGSAKVTRKATRSRGRKQVEEQVAVENAVIDALKRGIADDQPILLVKSGRDIGLFPTRTGVNHKAIERAIDPAEPLVEVFRTQRNGPVLGQWVRLSENGLRVLVAATPPDQRTQLWQAAARSYKQRIEALILDRGRFDIDQIRFEQARLVQRKNQLQAYSLDFVSQQMEALARERQAIEDAFHAATQCRSALTNAARLQRPDEGGRLGEPPNLETSLDFQRDLSEELVYAWQDSSSDEVRMQIERVLLNVGLERIGIPGQNLPFDGSLHVATESVLPDEEVEIVLPGWRLHGARGKYLIARARVAKVTFTRE